MMSAEPALPGVLADIERAAGRGAALRMALAFGGREIHVPKPNHLWRSPGHPLIMELGWEDAQTVSGALGGGAVYIPYARRAVAGYLRHALNWSLGDVARHLGISRTAVRRYVRDAEVPAAKKSD